MLAFLEGLAEMSAAELHRCAGGCLWLTCSTGEISSHILAEEMPCCPAALPSQMDAAEVLSGSSADFKRVRLADVPPAAAALVTGAVEVMTQPLAAKISEVPPMVRSCEQSVEMCPHGSPSAEAVAQDPATNSADSSPACDPASKLRAPSRDAGQVRLAALGL